MKKGNDGITTTPLKWGEKNEKAINPYYINGYIGEKLYLHPYILSISLMNPISMRIIKNIQR